MPSRTRRGPPGSVPAGSSGQGRWRPLPSIASVVVFKHTSKCFDRSLDISIDAQ